MRLDAVTDILIEDRRGVACSSSQDLLLSTSEPTPGIPRSNSVCVCVCVCVHLLDMYLQSHKYAKERGKSGRSYTGRKQR